MTLFSEPQRTKLRTHEGCKSCWPTVEVAQRLFQRLLVSNLLQLNNRCIHDVWYVTCSPAIGWRHHKTAWLPPTNNDHPTSQVATCLIFSVSYSLYINKTYQKQYTCFYVYIYIYIYMYKYILLICDGEYKLQMKEYPYALSKGCHNEVFAPQAASSRLCLKSK